MQAHFLDSSSYFIPCYTLYPLPVQIAERFRFHPQKKVPDSFLSSIHSSLVSKGGSIGSASEYPSSYTFLRNNFGPYSGLCLFKSYRQQLFTLLFPLNFPHQLLLAIFAQAGLWLQLRMNIAITYITAWVIVRTMIQAEIMQKLMHYHLVKKRFVLHPESGHNRIFSRH